LLLASLAGLAAPPMVAAMKNFSIVWIGIACWEKNGN